MKANALLAGIAALFLATGAAYANTKAARHAPDGLPTAMRRWPQWRHSLRAGGGNDRWNRRVF